MSSTQEYFEKITHYVLAKELLTPQDTVLLGFSAGPDSIFLLHWLIHFLKNPIEQMRLVYFNHQLRPEEIPIEIKICKEYAQKFNLAYTCRKLPVRLLSLKRPCSIETAGRELRRRYFAHLARLNGCKLVVTAHHGDDAVESFFMQLLRGAKSGLVGIRPKTQLTPEVALIRPLLMCSKSQILHHVAQQNWPYSIDSSNKDPEFLRNQVRLKLSPVLNELDVNYVEKIAATLDYLQGLEQDQDKKNSQIVRQAQIMQSSSESAFDRHVFQTMSHFEKKNVLFTLLKKYVKPDRSDKQITDYHVCQLSELLARGQGSLSLPGRFIASVTKTQLLIIAPTKDGLV